MRPTLALQPMRLFAVLLLGMISLIQPSTPTRARPAEPNVTTGTLALTVTNNFNEPIVGAYANLFDAASENFVASGSSDAAGKITFSNLSVSSYKLGVSDYTNAHVAKYYPNSDSLSGASPIAVTAGVTTSLNMTLQRSGALKVHVIDSMTEDPIPYISLVAAATDSQHLQHKSFFGTTNITGEATLYGFETDTYVLLARDFAGIYALKYYPNGRHIGEAFPINMVMGETSEVTISLDLGGWIEATPTGSITDTARYYPQFTLYLDDVANYPESPVGQRDGIVIQQTSPGGAGGFRIGGVPAGSYRLRGDIAYGQVVGSYSAGAATIEAADVITVSAGMTSTASVHFTSDSGTGNLEVRLRDADGNPVDNVNVRMSRWLSETGTLTATSNISGNVHFDAIPAGVLLLAAKDPAGEYRDEFYFNQTQLGSHPLSLFPGEHLVVTMTLDWVNPPPPPPTGGTLQAKVRNAAGDPLNGAQVAVYPMSSATAVNGGLTNGDGVVTISGLDGGFYRVGVAALGYESEFYNDKPSLDVADTIAVTSGVTTTISVTMELTATPIFTQVLSVNKASIYTVQNQGSAPAGLSHAFTATSAATPLHTFNSALNAGATGVFNLNTISAIPSGFSGQVLISSDQPITATVQPPPIDETGDITGTVTLSNGTPLANVWVTAYKEISGTLYFDTSTQTAATGKYALNDLWFGPYYLTFFDPATGRQQFFNQATTLSSATPVTVTAGATTPNINGVFLPPAPPLAGVSSPTGAVTSNPNTGAVSITMWRGNRSDITITVPAACPNNATPISVSLVMGSSTYTMTETPLGSGLYVATIPGNDAVSGPLVVNIDCPGADPPSTTIGTITLYDPSGNITDAVTKQPVVGATVFLYNVPGWRARTSPEDTAPQTCESNESKGGAKWSQRAPVSLGVVANTVDGRISPAINPQITGSNGRYAWDVAAGCWYVTVSAPGYADLVSPVVGVPSEVTDLDLELTPLPSGAAPKLDFSQAAASVVEDSGNVTVTVKLSAAQTRLVQVQYSVDASSTAQQGSDVETVFGTLQFAPGATEASFVVRLNDDSRYRGTRTLVITLSNAQGALLGDQASYTLSIREDDPAKLYVPLIKAP